MLRPLTSDVLPDVLALNAACEPHVGALELPALEALVQQSTVALVELDALGVAGFILAMDAAQPYRSPNYRWFVEHERSFLYVDRIAVAERCRGNGLGRALYDAVAARARALQRQHVVCEVNELPPNPASLAFHERLGFTRLGALVHVPNEKAVALLRWRAPAQ